MRPLRKSTNTTLRSAPAKDNDNDNDNPEDDDYMSMIIEDPLPSSQHRETLTQRKLRKQREVSPSPSLALSSTLPPLKSNQMKSFFSSFALETMREGGADNSKVRSKSTYSIQSRTSSSRSRKTRKRVK